MTGDVKDWAAAATPKVIALIQQLVRIPSRGGIDPYEPILDAMREWFAAHGLPVRTLVADGPVGLVCEVVGDRPGPRYVLDACIDTAPFGDPQAWRHPPTAGVVEEGWLHGRGAADSKAAVAIFAHIAEKLWAQRDRLAGSVAVLYDADEHTGRFGGAKAYFDGVDDIAGVMIGYPGIDELVVGGRGFLRGRLTVSGRAAHTGSSRTGSVNAVEAAAGLVDVLAEHREPGPVDPAMGLPPKLSVTAIHGGEGYSVVPDRCVVNVDARLTSTYPESEARRLLDTVAAEHHATVEFEESWPAYVLGESAPIRETLLGSAERHLDRPLRTHVAGPSNIGNYLARLGIDATAGFGVRYEGLHGTDERIDVATIPAVLATYHDAVLTLLQR